LKQKTVLSSIACYVVYMCFFTTQQNRYSGVKDTQLSYTAKLNNDFD